jgi:hypothetical protein
LHWLVEGCARTLVGAEALAAVALLAEGHGLLGLSVQALAHERVQRRQAVEQRRGVLGVQRVPRHARVNEGPQPVRGAAQLVVLLGRLDEGGEVQPTKALELLGLPGDAVELPQDLLEQLLAVGLAKLWLFGRVAGLREQPLALHGLVLAILLVAVLEADGQWL